MPSGVFSKETVRFHAYQMHHHYLLIWWLQEGTSLACSWNVYLNDKGNCGSAPCAGPTGSESTTSGPVVPATHPEVLQTGPIRKLSPDLFSVITPDISALPLTAARGATQSTTVMMLMGAKCALAPSSYTNLCTSLPTGALSETYTQIRLVASL